MSDPNGGTTWTPGSYSLGADEPGADSVQPPAEASATPVEDAPAEVADAAAERTSAQSQSVSEPNGGAAWTPGSYALDADEAPPAAAPAAPAAPATAAPADSGGATLAATTAATTAVTAVKAETPAAPAPAAGAVKAETTTPAPPAPAVVIPPALAAVAPPPLVVAPPPASPAQPLPPPLRPPPPAATALPPPLRPPPPDAVPQPERIYASAPPPPIYAAPPPAAAPAARPAGASRVDVVNREGWRKEFPLLRSLAWVGSQPGSDIYLPQPDVAPRHVQFVPSPVNRAGYRAINFSTVPLVLRLPTGEVRTVPPRGAAEIADGDAVELAGYSLIFRSGEVQSGAIQARVDLAGTRLEVARPLDGALYIRNAGDKAGVQFAVSAQGFDERFLQIEPGPVLFPGVEKRVGLRIIHPRMPAPPAGDYTLKLVITASDVYPGESAIVSATFTVAPFFAHSVRFVSVVPEMSLYTLR